MVGFAVAAPTVIAAIVHGSNATPSVGGVTIGALALIVIGPAVARHTVSKTYVVERGLAPIFSVVAIGALTYIVTLSWGMAVLAVREVSMIEPHLLPVVGAVALGALTIIVILRGVVHVARVTSGGINVIKSNIFPVGGARMTMHASTEIQRVRENLALLVQDRFAPLTGETRLRYTGRTSRQLCKVPQIVIRANVPVCRTLRQAG